MLLQNVLDIAIPAITFFLMTLVGMDLTAPRATLAGFGCKCGLSKHFGGNRY